MGRGFEDEGRGPADAFVIRAPAKVNLGLRIVGRREDGYHLLESLFVPIDWSDDLSIRWMPGPGCHVEFSVETLVEDGVVLADDIPRGPDNLVHRAALGFLEAANQTGRLSVGLTKRLPIGAGLGGGSSDAGALLRGLREMWPGAVPAEGLARIALTLGADVPFFLDPRPAWVGGIGERVEPLDAMPALWLVVANPGVPLATPKVFGEWDAMHATPSSEAAGALRAALGEWMNGDPTDPTVAAARLARMLQNDLEPAAVRLVPAIGALRRRFSELGALGSSLSGSGASVFGVFASEAAAHAAAATLARTEQGWARAVRTLAAP